MTITNLAPLLREHAFFENLKPDYIDLLVECASNVCFESGQLIFRQGEDANRFYLIRQGKVAIEIHAPGKSALTLQTITAQEVLGWSWLFPPYRWQFDARALELTRAIALDGRCLRSKCDRDPVLGCELMKRFSAIMLDTLQATYLQLLDLYGLPNQS